MSYTIPSLPPRTGWRTFRWQLLGPLLVLMVTGGGVPADDPMRADLSDPFAPAAPEGARTVVEAAWVKPDRPYAFHSDAPLHAKLQRVEQTEHCTVDRVEFDGAKHDRVPGLLYTPRGRSGRMPAVLLQYGSGGHKKTDYIVLIGRLFAEAGFVVLTIDSPGRGERRGPRDQEPKLGLVDRDRFTHYLADYARAVDYLCSLDNVDPERIAYVGISWGAITGIVYTAHDPRIRVVVSLVGGGRFLGILSGMGRDISVRKKSLDPVDHVRLIEPRPLLLLNVKRDQLVPLPFSTALHQAAGPSAKKVWLDTDHYFRHVDISQVVKDEVIRFVAEHIGKSP